MQPDAIRDATFAAISLIGNASSRISRMRREKIIGSVKKTLLPLAKEDDSFDLAPPGLFGSDFARKSKEFLDKALRSAIPPKREETRHPSFFRGGSSLMRGATDPGAELRIATEAADRATKGGTHPRTSRQSSYCTCDLISCTCSCTFNSSCSKYPGNNCTHGRSPSSCTGTASRPSKSLCQQLGNCDKRPMGYEYGTGMPHTVCLRPIPISQTPPHKIQSISQYVNKTGSQRTSVQRGDSRESNPTYGVFTPPSFWSPKRMAGKDLSST